MSSVEDKAKNWRFSLRELFLIGIGSAISLAGLRALGDLAHFNKLFYVICFLPIFGGMFGLLVNQFRGGVIGAVMGGAVALVIREIIW